MDGLDGLKSYPLARRGMMMTGLIAASPSRPPAWRPR